MQDPYTARGRESKKGASIDIDQNSPAKVQAYRDRKLRQILKSTRRGQAHKAHKPEIQM